MPTIFADKSGVTFNAFQTSHVNARDASTAANGVNTTSTSVTPFLYSVGPSRGGGLAYRVDRIFIYFDTSTITSTPASATFSIQRTTSAPVGEFRIIKANAFGGDGQTSLAASDFDAIPGFSAGNTMDGNVTEYCDNIIEASVWGTSNDYNNTDINLNSTALSDMTSNDFLILAIVDSGFDYKNVDAGGPALTRLAHYQVAFSGTTRDPKIDYVAGGYSHGVNTLSSTNISQINTVAIANIAELNGL
tara:strand:- start:15533 stop:16273 length:741 start_codon:yes stop_codon:yes gene_type:complete